MKRHTMFFSATVLAIALPFTAAATAPGEDFLTTWDGDGDGQVTLAEVLERRADLFATFDENEDGKLSAEELAAHDEMRGAMQQQDRLGRAWGGEGQGGMGPRQGGGRMAMGQQGGNGFGHGPAMGPRQGMNHGFQQQAQAMTGMALDTDGDGFVSQDEFVAMGNTWFARFDRDGNGSVTEDDFGPQRR